MRPRGTAIVILVLGTAFLSAYWAVSHAQEGQPLFPAPPVLPPADVPIPPLPKPPEKKVPAKYPGAGSAPKPKADPSLIIPAEVYELPRPLHSEDGVKIKTAEARSVMVVEEDAHIRQVGGMLPPLPGAPGPNAPPPPLFPPLPTPLPAPTPEVKVMDLALPPPIVEPTKLPVVEPTKPLVLPAPPPEPSKVLIPPQMGDLPNGPPVAIQTIDQPKAFVRIQSAGTKTLSLPPIAPPTLAEPNAIYQTTKLGPAPLAEPTGRTLASLQTPHITVEKRCNPSARAGETLVYQLVVRNHGPVQADRIRIEEILSDGVRIVSAEPLPSWQGNKAIWVLPALAVNQEVVLQVSAQGATALESRISVQVGAGERIDTTVQRPVNPAETISIQRPRSPVESITVQLLGPAQVAVGQAALFEVRFTSQAGPLTGVVLHGYLPEGLDTPNGRTIESEMVAGTIPPLTTKTLRMPTTATKPGRYTVNVKVTAQGGVEGSASTAIEVVAAGTLQVQQAPTTRLFVGHDGDLKIEITNQTGRAMRNVTVANRLDDGFDFVAANERGLFQANTRTVYWLLDSLAAGASRSLILRVHASKQGQYQNTVTAKADGITAQCNRERRGHAAGAHRFDDARRRQGSCARSGPRDRLRDPGQKSGSRPPPAMCGAASAVPPGMTPKTVEGCLYAADQAGIVFEPLALGPHENLVLRVSAVAQSVGDQRVRFAVACDQSGTPIQRESQHDGLSRLNEPNSFQALPGNALACRLCLPYPR